MRRTAGRLGWLVGMACAHALCAAVARADYCAYAGTATFGAGGVTVSLMALPTPLSCGVAGARCADGTVCQRLAPADVLLYCAPALTDPVVWSCTGGCVCPSTGAGAGTRVDVMTSDGVMCLCDYGGSATLCPGIGTGDAERFVRCHTALMSADTGSITSLRDGDCDGDGFSNSCEGTGGDRCEPCAHPDPASCTTDVVEIVVPECAADGGSATVDAGATASDGGLADGGNAGTDGSVPGSDAGGAPRPDAGGTDDFDAAATPGDPLAGVTFRGAGGCACGIATPRRPGHPGAGAAMLALGLAAAWHARRRRA